MEMPNEKERIRETIKMIPRDVESILDVGCGNGALINSLMGRYQKLVGLDSSKEALKHVRGDKIPGSIEGLPFGDNSFDLVICLETLEHLPQEVFTKGLLELQRVSKRYVLVSVPNNEPLEISLEKCPACNCWFHPFFHLRSFDEKKMKGLFEKFEMQSVKAIGAPAVDFPKKLVKPYLIMKMILNYPLFHPYSICPACGYRLETKGSEGKEISTTGFKKKIYGLLKSAAKIRKTKKTSLIALYKKSNN